MKTILEKISGKNTFKEIQEYIIQSNCCTRSSRHDYAKFIPIFSRIVSLSEINFQKEFVGKLSNSQIYTLQKLCLDLKIVEATSTVGEYRVLIFRSAIDDFNDLVDLFYLKQNEIINKTKPVSSGVPEQDAEISESKPKRKYTKRKRLEGPDEEVSGTVNLVKTHLPKLLDMVYYFDFATLTLWHCQITGLSWDVISAGDADEEKRVILLRLESPFKDENGNQLTKVFQHIRVHDIYLSESQAKSSLLTKIKIVK